MLACSIFLSTSPAQDVEGNKITRFHSLSCPEKLWVITHPFVAGRALRISENVMRVSSAMAEDTLLDRCEQGGQVDAFRHAYWMAMLALGTSRRKATLLGRAHEKGNRRDFKKNKFEEGVIPDAVSCEMDLWNNKTGLDIVREHPGVQPEELIHLVRKVILEGKCRIIKRYRCGKFLDRQGNIIPDQEWMGKWENARCLVPSDNCDIRQPEK